MNNPGPRACRRLVDDKDFFGLAPGKEASMPSAAAAPVSLPARHARTRAALQAGLKYAGVVKVTDVLKDAAGKPIELRGMPARSALPPFL